MLREYQRKAVAALSLVFALSSELVEAREDVERVSQDATKVDRGEKAPDMSLRPENLFTKFYLVVSGVFRNPTLQQKMYNSYNEDAGVKGRRDFFLFQATVTDGETRTVQDTRMRDSFQSGATLAFANELQSRSELLRQLTQGLDFQFDISSVFASKESPYLTPTRYGLVKQQQNTANGDTVQVVQPGLADADYWTIGPLAPLPTAALAVPEEPRDPRLPTGRFKGRFEPQATAVAGGHQAWGMRLNLAQEQQYYALIVPVLPHPDAKAMEHTFRVPVYSKFSLGEKFDAKFDPIQSSAFNLFNRTSGPQVNAHYLYREEMYASELVWGGPGYTMSLVGKVPRAWTPEDAFERQGSIYKLDYTRSL